jgi:methylated-DNA-[protein]-cysteine S-methyltransferase
VIRSPIGELTVSAAGGKIVELLLQADRAAQERAAGPAIRRGAGPAGQCQILDQTARQLDDYFAGRLRQFSLPLAPRGTAFQLAVWEVLRQIPYARTVTYGEIAKRVGNPKASRAVGGANNRNPIAVIVPCHRVIGSGGALVGYGGGLETKQYLLDLERAHA